MITGTGDVHPRGLRNDYQEGPEKAGYFLQVL
jgi:hypothetical protein